MRDPDFFLFEYAPVTTGFSIVDARLDEVLDRWIRWQREGWEIHGFKMPIQHIDGPLAAKLDALLPLDGRARLLTETVDGRIAVFANFSGSNGSTDADYLADNFKREKLRFVMNPDRKSKESKVTPSTQFEWVDFGTKVDDWGLHVGRFIAAHVENRWEWHERGTPFPWEETEVYTATRIKDRLTTDMLERYAKHMGVDLFDPDYFSGRAVITRIGALPDPNEPWYDSVSHYPNQ